MQTFAGRHEGRPFHRNETWLGGYKGRFGYSPGKWQSVWLHQGQEEGVLVESMWAQEAAVLPGWWENGCGWRAGGHRDGRSGSSRTVE